MEAYIQLINQNYEKTLVSFEDAKRELEEERDEHANDINTIKRLACVHDIIGRVSSELGDLYNSFINL